MERYLRGADVRDVAEGPVHDGNLNEDGPYRRTDLAPKSDPRRHLHVMSQLEVPTVDLCLAERNDAVHLEDHDSDGAPRKHVAGDEGRDHVQRQLYVRDTQNHRGRYHENEGHYDGDEEGPPRQLRVVAKDSAESQGHRRQAERNVPPIGGVDVLLDHLEMDIRLLISRSLKAVPDLLSVEKTGVHEGGGQRSERKPNVKCVRRRQEERGIFLVLL